MFSLKIILFDIRQIPQQQHLLKFVNHDKFKKRNYSPIKIKKILT